MARLTFMAAPALSLTLNGAAFFKTLETSGEWRGVSAEYGVLPTARCRLRTDTTAY